MSPSTTARALVVGAALAATLMAPWPRATSEVGEAGPVMLGGALVLSLLAITSWALLPHRDERPRRLSRAFPAGLVFFALFVAWGTVGAELGVAPFHAERMLAVWTAGLGVCAALCVGIPNEVAARWAARILLFGAAALALYGLVEWNGGHEAGGRLSATFANADCFAALLLLGLGLGLGLLGDGPREDVIFSLLSLAAIIPAIVLTGSRAAIIGTAVVVAVLCIGISRQHLGRPALMRVLLPCVMVVMLGLASGGFIALANRWALGTAGEGEQGFAVRAMVLKGALPTLARAPWWGCGAGNFQYAFQPFRPQSTFRGYVNQAHIEPVQVVIETGVIGLVLLSLAVFFTVRSGWRSGRSMGTVALGAAAALCGEVAYGTVNFALPVPADFVWLSAAAGLTLAFARIASRRGASMAPAGVGVLFLCAAFGASFAALTGWRTFEGARLARQAQAQAAELHWEDALAAINQALALQPRNERFYAMRAEMSERMGLFTDVAGTTDQAQADMQHALDLNGAAKGLRIEAARFFDAAGDRGRAERVLQQAREACPTDLGPWTELAVLYANGGRFRDAAECLYHVLPELPETLRPLASTLVDAESSGQDGAGLLEQWRRASARAGASSQSTEVLHSLALQAADMATRDGSKSSASAFYRVLISWDAADSCALLGLAQEEKSKGDAARARALLETAVQSGATTDACYDDAYFALVDIHLEQRDVSGAVGLLEKYLESTPWSTPARLRLSHQYVVLDRSEMAIKILQDGLRREPDNADLQSALADLYKQAGTLRPVPTPGRP